MFQILILCAGKGTRMGELTKSIAKPALSVNKHSIVSRLVAQSAKFLQPTYIWINIGHCAITVLEALNNSNSLDRVRFIYEPNLLGSLNTLCYLYGNSPIDTLVIHGDLVLSNSYIKTLYENIESWRHESFIIYHKRGSQIARSQIKVREGYIYEFSEREKTEESYYSYVSSGIYFFKSSDIKLLVPSLQQTQISPEGFRLLIAKSKLRGIYQSTSERIAVEDIFSLKRASRISKRWV